MINNIFQLPDLPYAYDSLGVYISKDIMYLHHSKHHQAYVDKLNLTLEKFPELKGKSLEELLTDANNLSENSKTPIINFGGGHYNHILFWNSMSPNGGGEPSGDISKGLEDKYGSYQGFVDEFSEKAMGVFGSGWAWLMDDFSIATTPNQVNPIMNGSNAPLLGLDVWEHAYYLDYKNKRDDYVKAWWNIVNWKYAEDNYSNKKILS